MLEEIPLGDWKTYLRWQVLTAYAALPELALRRRELQFLFPRHGGDAGERGALEAHDLADQRQPRPAGRPDVRREIFSARLQAAHGGAGAPTSRRPSSPLAPAALDERDHPQAGPGKAAGHEDRRSVIPPSGRTTSELEIGRDSLVGNCAGPAGSPSRRTWTKLGKPVDTSEWDMTPQTVNAYYNPVYNKIIFPAGILQPPFFDADADDAVNYGAIGMVIGHEMSARLRRPGPQVRRATATCATGGRRRTPRNSSARPSCWSSSTAPTPRRRRARQRRAHAWARTSPTTPG